MPYPNVPPELTGKMDRCVDKVMASGKDKETAIGICYSSIVGKKEIDIMDQDTVAEDIIQEELSTDNKNKGYVPYGVTTFADLKKAREAQEKANQLVSVTDDLIGLTMEIISSPEITDKAYAIKRLADEFSEQINEDMESKEANADQDGDSCDHEDLDLVLDLEQKSVDALPDSAFLYVEEGEKDGEGRTTPHNKRHFPYKDEKGKIDLPSLRSAVSYIPNSDTPGLSPEMKKALQERSRRILSKASKDAEFSKESILDYVVNKVKSLFGMVKEADEEGKEGLMIWKEESTGQYMWLARYSNNFRDDDNPPEIISEKSHLNFVKMVEDGLADLPELWLWHVPEWRIGKSTDVAYDDTGFAIAVGYFNKGCETIAEWLSKQQDLLVSHGMPESSIVRDKNDKSVIISHKTVEISPLPGWAAANKITGFVVLDAHDQSTKGEDAMSIPEKKKKSLIEDWKIDPQLLDRLEQQNAQDAIKATEDGRERKEANVEDEDGKTAEASAESATETDTQATKDESEQSTDQMDQQEEQTGKDPEHTASHSDYPTRTEVAEAFGAVLGEMQVSIDGLGEKLNALGKEITSLKETDETKIAAAAENVPAASLADMLAKTVIGRKETAVDGRTTLGKDKPKEAKSAEPRVGISFIDQMLAGRSGEEE